MKKDSLFTTETQSTQSKEFLIEKYSDFCELYVSAVKQGLLLFLTLQGYAESSKSSSPHLFPPLQLWGGRKGERVEPLERFKRFERLQAIAPAAQSTPKVLIRRDR